MCTASFVVIGCCVNELHGHNICPYCNEWPEAVYKNYIVYKIVYMFVRSELEVAITSPNFVTLYLMVSEIAKYIA